MAIIDCVPAVFRVTVKVPVPLVRVAGAGRVAAGSVDVIVTWPAEPVATLPYESSAVTVTLWAAPAEVGFGYPDTVRVAAEAGFTVMLVCEPVIEPVVVSVAVMEPVVVAVFSMTPMKVFVPASVVVKA